MFRQCSIPGCPSKRNSVTLHKFPKTEIGLQKWVKCINSDYFRNLSSKQLQKLHVCHKHFEKRLTTGNFLRQSAYPSLFTREEIDTGVPSLVLDEDSENAQCHVEHDYARKRKHEDHTYSELIRNPLSEIRQPFNTVHNAPSTSYIEKCDNQPKQHVTCESGEVQPKIIDNVEKPIEQGLDHSGPSTSGSNFVTPLKCKRKRVINKLNLLSPRCRRLYNEYRSAKKQLDFATRAKKAMKMSKEKYFEKLTAKMNPLAKKLFWLQIKQCTKHQLGRRYTEDEKLIALSIMKQSPKSYRFLQKNFILPSKDTLNKFIRNLKLEPGINPQIFSSIKKEVEHWQENKKYCSVIFDEVALEPGLSYDKFKDRIIGFVELESKTRRFADHALVFMIRGALFKWQQPICFYFCEGATSAVMMKNIIKKVTAEIIGTGLIPVAFVSDQGTAFRSAFNMLLEETRRQQLLSGDKIDETIKILDHNISVIYDPPHLIKGLRNNFLNKNIIFEGKLCKWSDIVDVYLTDCKHAQSRILHKLNDEHVIPEKIKKMKVKNCTRVFSQTGSAALAYTAEFSHYADGKEVSATLRNTSELIKFFDKLFDSCNGSASISKQRGKPLRAAVQSSSEHETFWEGAIKQLENMKFVNESNKNSVVPSQKNFITTLKSLRRLWDFFKSKGCKFMRPRYFNSDPIENFFGQVRAYNFRNNDPSCQAFKQIFRSLLITRFIHFHSENFNCEDAPAAQILKLKNLLLPCAIESSDEAPKSSFSNRIFESAGLEDIQAEARRERLNVHSRAYTVGWVIRKCFKKIKCHECKKNLCQKEISSVHKWVSHREYKGFKKTQKLTYPSENAVRSFGNIVKEVNEYLESTPHEELITLNIINNIKAKYSFDFLTCKEHKSILLEYFLAIAVKLCVINWCSVINKILRGVDILRIANRTLPTVQNMAYVKYQKKLKNKRLNK